MEPFLFWLFAITSVLGSLGVVVSRNPIRGALWLIASLFSVAILFVLLQAHLLAALEVLVYAGAVMVLFLFVIMLLNLRDEELGPRRFTLVKFLGVLAAAYLLKVLAPPLMAAAGSPATLPDNFGTVEGIGAVLFRDYLLPFELTSLLLLIAVVGAVVLAKRKI
ncbi:MAG: NADH-quinone oxidoreductase subunit J [Myxococcota bacterium]